MTETLITDQSNPPAQAPILEVRDLSVTFPNPSGRCEGRSRRQLRGDAR